jgi:adenylate kinase family enzyme
MVANYCANPLQQNDKQLFDVNRYNEGFFVDVAASLREYADKILQDIDQTNPAQIIEFTEKYNKTPEQFRADFDKSPEWLCENIKKQTDIIKETGKTETVKMEGREAIQDKCVKEYFNPSLNPEAARYFENNKVQAEQKTITVVVGPPAAGKSTICENIQAKNNAMIIDSDIVKTGHGDYEGLKQDFGSGEGASKVSRESTVIIKRVLDNAKENGMNIIFPTLSMSGKWLEEVQKFKDAGYKVNLVLNDVPPQECLKRSYKRYFMDALQKGEGRLVTAEILSMTDNSPYKSFYEQYKAHQNGESKLFDSFEAYSNDVPYKQRPQKIDLESMQKPNEKEQVAQKESNDWSKNRVASQEAEKTIANLYGSIISSNVSSPQMHEETKRVSENQLQGVERN